MKLICSLLFLGTSIALAQTTAPVCNPANGGVASVACINPEVTPAVTYDISAIPSWIWTLVSQMPLPVPQKVALALQIWIATLPSGK